MYKSYFKLKEKFVKKYTIVNLLGKIDETEVFVNPQALTHFKSKLRGVIDRLGNLYIWDNPNIIHLDVIKYLKSDGFLRLPSITKNGYLDWMIDYGVLPVQEYSLGVFYVSESIHSKYVLKNSDKVKAIMDLAKKKNKTIKFIPKPMP